MTKEMVLVDVYGKEFTFAIANLRWMIVTGWIFYLISLISTYIYYKIHPSYCNLSWKAIKNRLTINDARLELSDGLEKGEINLDGNNPKTQSRTKQENIKNSDLQPLHLQQQSSLSTNPRNLIPQNKDLKGARVFFLAINDFLCYRYN